MLPRERPELQPGSEAKPLPAAAAAWENSFVEDLERYFAHHGWQLPEAVTLANYQHLMTLAFVQTLANSGATTGEIVGLFRESIDRLSRSEFADYLAPEFTSRLEDHMRIVRADIASEQAAGK